MHALMNRPRGLIAVLNNFDGAGQVLNELNSAFASFRQRNDSRLESVETALDGLNARMEALKVGSSDADVIGNAGDRRRAVNNLGKFARTGQVSDLTAGLKPFAAATTDSDPDGGFLVPTELSTEIMRMQWADNAMRRLSRIVLTSSSTYSQLFQTDYAGSGWVGEKQSRPATDLLNLAKIDIPSGEIYANPAITQRYIDDAAFDLGTFMTTEITEAFNAQEAGAFIHGDGMNKPMGFLSYPIEATADATRALGRLQYVPTGDATGFPSSDAADVLITLAFSLKSKYRQNGRWLMNSATLAIISKFKDGDGNHIFQRAITEGAPNLLLGYPIEIDEEMSDIGANAYPIAFGDFKRGYIITDRTGVNMLRDPYTAKPYVLFYTTKRVGGGLLDSRAIKLLKCATS